MREKYDFSGWATKNDIPCSDGRTIRHNAFKDCDGTKVPLVWNHNHDEVDNVLGHALLENREEGVYAYCSFNNTEAGQVAKEYVRHGDITSLSIYANKLKQVGGDVMHGIIREVSLVMAGANPGAFIDSVMVHGELVDEYVTAFPAIEGLEMYHSEEDAEIELPYEEEVEDQTDEEEVSEESDEDLEHADDSEETVEEVFDTLSEKQKTAVYAIIGQIAKGDSDEDDDEEENDMSHNLFEQDDVRTTLSHSEMATIINDAKRLGSLKESVLAHSQEYGIENIDWLFPEAKAVEGGAPGFIKRNPDEWVSVVMNGVHHTPFARIKMMFADLREDDARAKGYAQKGKLKKEEVFGLIKRAVDPTTIYKKQKLDKDDIRDITDFNVVSWLKSEMRMMLDEEIARAILFGDGRSAMSDDKIKEANIIPAVSDASLYTITQTLPSNYTAEDVIDAAVLGQNDYEGSGNTIMFVANTTVTNMLLLKDTNKHRLYKDVNDLALACSVNKIVKVPASIIPSGIVGLIIDLKDYNVGADKGGAVDMFEDFDIDYNQEKYLIETRCSGALYRPFSAIVLKEAGAAG